MNIGIYHTVVHSLPTQLTCSFVNHRQHCSVVRLTCKVYGKGWILTPNDIKIPEIFEIWTWRPWLRPGVLHQCKFSFQSVQWFCDFFPSWLYCIFFLGHAPRSNLWMDFHDLWLTRHVFTQGRSFWGLRQYWNSFGGNIPQKTLQRGHECKFKNRKFQAKPGDYKNCDILQSINTINVQF